MDKNQGYTILKAVMLENGRIFALGEHPIAPSPYVTWACYDDEKGRRQYEWGHYGDDLAAMESDFTDRVQEYQRLFDAKIIRIEAPGLYKYYAVRQPEHAAAVPTPPNNAPDEVVNYGQHIPVEDGVFFAWGHLTYTRPLPQEVAVSYGLRPALSNPNLQRGEYELAQIAGMCENTEPYQKARKQAGKDRGRSVPKKKKPDRGGR